MTHIIDATETANYVMKEGDGPAACLKFDGNFQVLIQKGKRNEKLAKSGNTTVSLVEIVQDADFDGAKGALIYHSFPITGKVESGANAGSPNVRTLIDLCKSVGREDLANQIIGKKFDVDGLLADLIGDGKSTMAYARLTQQENDKGNLDSKPAWYLMKDKYNETKQSGANFRTTPNARKRPSTGAAADAAAKAAAAAAAGGAVATDQMTSEV